ncbi:MAG: outer membrane beta-barrel protein [Novosphingobium sp.]
MRNIIIALAASAALATPALANETRVEARGGVIWSNGQSEGTAGVAAGYDFDLGSSAFAGAEVSADKILTSGTHVAVGFTGRLGAKVGGGKLYANGGYTTSFASGADSLWHAGAGYEYPVTSSVYVKAEYRHFFERATSFGADAVVAGVGMKF